MLLLVATLIIVRLRIIIISNITLFGSFARVFRGKLLVGEICSKIRNELIPFWGWNTKYKLHLSNNPSFIVVKASYVLEKFLGLALVNDKSMRGIIVHQFLDRALFYVVALQSIPISQAYLDG